ncbi:hypothetical protein [Spirosoma montaniterrae]|uniref:hypothetical protein n=1 Tax=Spirosoma montaniterrae TaxID=1178516 RepID=UPI0012F92AFA|nr:hypothetical protein [Spirosoma montaniterrae]
MKSTAWISTCIVASLVLLAENKSLGQSLIAGIPSADVAKRGHIEFTHESQWASQNSKLKWNSFNFFTYGIANRTELAVSLVNVGSPGTGNVAAGIGYKTIVPLRKGEDVGTFRERKLSVGQMVYAAVGPEKNTNRDRVGGWIYSHVSTRLWPSRTRLTGGLSYGSSHVFGFRTTNLIGLNGLVEPMQQRVPLSPFTFIGGIEQPITKHVGLLADWISGRHDIAALITGVQFTIAHQVLILAYKRANDRVNDTDALVTEVMIHF